jgi:hypothetical protein
MFVLTALPCGLVSFAVPPVHTGLNKSRIALQRSALPAKYEFCDCGVKLYEQAPLLRIVTFLERVRKASRYFS